MNEQIRVGVVGTSWWADMMYLPVLKNHSQASISAICGRNQMRAEEMAGKYGIPNVFTNYQEMIERGNLDAIVIAVPDDLHFPIAIAALDAGLHVLCEKPLAFNLDQARQMLAKAEAKQVKHMTFFTWRWAPYFRTLHRLVSEGYIGRIFDAQFSYVGGYARGAGYQWKWDQEHGLGVLGDLGSHMIDLARLTVGEIARVQANLAVRVQKPAGDVTKFNHANDSASLTVQFANGASGTIFASAAAELGNRGQEQRVILYGEDGTLEVMTEGNQYVVRGIKNKETEFHDLPVPAEFLAGCDRDASVWDQIDKIFLELSVGPRLFIDSILDDKAVSPGFYDGVKAQEVIEAAFESDRSGCWVNVDRS
jgi:predicted dehydrogenase